MNKLSLLTFLVLIISGCSLSHKYDISRALTVTEGDSLETVITKLGSPVADELSDGINTLHYCNTGYGSDRFVAIYLKDDAVIAKKSYTVTIRDTNGVTGDCFNFIKRGSYIEPDSVIEIRAKHRFN